MLQLYNQHTVQVLRMKEEKGEKEETRLSVGVVAQWQSTGGLSQRPSVRFPAAPLFFLSLCCFKGLRTVTTQIISIGLRTYVSPIYQAPYAVMKLKFFRNQKHTRQLLPINLFRYIQKSMKSAISLCSHTLGVADSYPGGHTHTHTHIDKVAEAAVAGEGTLGGSCGGVQAPRQI